MVAPFYYPNINPKFDRHFIRGVIDGDGSFYIKNNALKLGALGCSISGSGPTIFAITDSSEIANNIGDTSKEYYDSENLDCAIYRPSINYSGPIIV